MYFLTSIYIHAYGYLRVCVDIMTSISVICTRKIKVRVSKIEIKKDINGYPLAGLIISWGLI